MFGANAGVIPKNIHEALQDDQDWRNSGQPPRKKIWPMYKAARDPDSYRKLTRPQWVKILARQGFDDPCPISQEEWAKRNPQGVRQLEKAKTRAAENQRQLRDMQRHVDKLQTDADAGDRRVEDLTRRVEVAGAIKWFDASKGYGFIVPDNGLPDVLLHVTCLRRDGFQTAQEGARVVCEVLQRPRGLQAFQIVKMDESAATP